jgi:hypothetical protein
VTELSQICDLYGGGSYELVARGTLKKGADGKERKGIVARQSYRLPGEPKPLVPNAAPPVVAAPAPVHAPAPQTDTAAILTFMGQQMTAQMQMMGTVITAALGNRGGDNGTSAAISALGDVVKAALARPAESTTPAQDPLKMIMDLGDWLNGVRSGATEIAKKAAAGEDTTIDLNNLVEAANKAVDVVKKAKGIAESGAPPHVAADQLAQAAAE